MTTAFSGRELLLRKHTYCITLQSNAYPTLGCGFLFIKCSLRPGGLLAERLVETDPAVTSGGV
jgi:hypothetical protein